MPSAGVRSALEANRRAAIAYAGAAGTKHLRALLERSAKELEERIAGLAPGMEQTFTAERMRAVLAQVTLVLRQLQPGMLRAVVDSGSLAAAAAARNTVAFLKAADAEYRGVGTQPLALEEARMFDAATQGAKASLLRRLMTSGSKVPGADPVPSPAKGGILSRYGASVVAHFERVLQQHVIQRTSWEDATDALKEKSPFLQGAPAHWAERILRTESMGSYGRAAHEANKEADEQLGDVVKILVATLDDRCASDSRAVHGQIRRPEEPFETWFGLMQHPPNRPNDREVVVTHRISWPITKGLVPRTRAEVVARWKKEGRKGPPPPTPPDTTVDRRLFGRGGP